METTSMNKYRNKKTTIDGIVFDSRLEASRHLTLKARERAGEISELEIQPKFVLQPAHKKLKLRAIIYVADFAYYEIRDGVRLRIIEDAKGVETPVFKLKRKLLLPLLAENEKLEIIK